MEYFETIDPPPPYATLVKYSISTFAWLPVNRDQSTPFSLAFLFVSRLASPRFVSTAVTYSSNGSSFFIYRVHATPRAIILYLSAEMSALFDTRR